MVSGVSYPDIARSHCVFNDNVYKFLENRNGDLTEIKESLKNPASDDEVVADLFVLNQMLDDGTEVKDVWRIYPELSKYNQTKNPNIQTLLAGVYRKTKIPDAFGPLVVMLIQNAINPPKDATFNPDEEIGGAILDYLA